MSTDLVMSQPLSGIPMAFGDHFRAHSFRERDVGKIMHPLLMVDHFWMKRDTFGWHAHSGFSAVTYLFEDSRSAHHNADSTGDRTPIQPGSLHWLVAGSGAMHRERPEGEDALVHGLQIFVDLPAEMKSVEPYSVHVEGSRIPKVERDGVSVRVVAGQFGGVASPAQLPQPFLLYDILQRDKTEVKVPLPANWGVWFYTVRGKAALAVEGQSRTLEQYCAIALNTGSEEQIASIQSESLTQVVLLAGAMV